MDDAIDDLAIQLAPNHVFLCAHGELCAALSISAVEGRVPLQGAARRRRRIASVRTVSRGRRPGCGAIEELQDAASGGAAGCMRDTLISTQPRTELLLDVAVLHVNYDIETVNGIVDLIGIAQNETRYMEEVGRVVGHVRTVPGVRRLVSHAIRKEDRRRQSTSPRGLRPLTPGRRTTGAFSGLMNRPGPRSLNAAAATIGRAGIGEITAQAIGAKRHEKSFLFGISGLGGAVGVHCPSGAAGAGVSSSAHGRNARDCVLSRALPDGAVAGARDPRLR